MRVTSRGQVTIPMAFRKKLGINPQTEVAFELIGDAIRIRKAKEDRPRIRAAIDKMRGRATTGMTTDQILALTRG